MANFTLFEILAGSYEMIDEIQAATFALRREGRDDVLHFRGLGFEFVFREQGLKRTFRQPSACNFSPNGSIAKL